MKANNILKFLFPTILLLSSWIVQAQAVDGQLVYAPADTMRLQNQVGGVVRDSETGDPIPYVTVAIQGRYFSTVTNAEGAFTIKSDRPIHGLILSHIGYRTLSVPIAKGREGEPLKISMTPSAITLKEALIIARDPYEIISWAMHKIPDNYPMENELFDTFYRETVQKRNRYIYISEAVSNLYKTPYTDGTYRERVAVKKSRLLVSPKTSDTLSVKVIGGPTQAIYLDVVKNSSFLLNDEELTHYSFEMLQPVTIGDRAQFAIRIIPTDSSVEYALQTGVIYIDQERLSFTRIELSLDMKDPDKATRLMLVRKPAGLRFTPREMSLLVDYNYDEQDNLSRISYVRSTFRFNCDWRKKLFRTSFTAVNEMVTTYRHPRSEVVQPARSEAFRSYDALYDKTNMYLDSEFWKDYNIIEPTESLQNAIGRLKKQYQKQDGAK